MHQHQALDLRPYHLAKRRPEPARLHRHLYRLAAKLPKYLRSASFSFGTGPACTIFPLASIAVM
jgi:hypothetical protein